MMDISDIIYEYLIKNNKRLVDYVSICRNASTINKIDYDAIIIASTVETVYIVAFTEHKIDIYEIDYAENMVIRACETEPILTIDLCDPKILRKLKKRVIDDSDIIQHIMFSDNCFYFIISHVCLTILYYLPCAIAYGGTISSYPFLFLVISSIVMAKMLFTEVDDVSCNCRKRINLLNYAYFTIAFSTVILNIWMTLSQH